MARKSNAVAAIQASTVRTTVAEPEMAPALRTVVGQIDLLFSNAQTTSLRAFWQIGKHIAAVANDPESYLTAAQKDAAVDPSALLISIFSPIYSAEQMRSAETFYEKYPSERELDRLLNLRNEENPRWRLSASHVQLLTQIADDEQRQAVEEKCADEALTAKTLAKELQEIRGKKSSGGRKHEAPKGLKNQLQDLLHHIQRFIARSETLWLGEDAETSIYDQFMNTAPGKRAGTPTQHFEKIVETLTRLSDVVGDHIAMANKVLEATQTNEDDEDEDEDEDDPADDDVDAEDDEDDEEPDDADESDDLVADARRAAAAAAAARRKQNNITR
jgi:hypothetical protein